MATAAPATAPLTFPRRRERPKPRAKIAHFTAEQLQRLLRSAKAKGPREWAMVLFAFSHGARVSEVCNLKISDLNFRTGQVHIDRLKGSLESTQFFLKEKGQPLLDEAAAFRAWLAIREPDSDEFVFNSRKSVRLDRSSVHRIFVEICKAAGIEDRSLWHFHTLKHSTGMLLVERGANAFHIRQRLGHRSFSSTLAYINVTDRAADEATVKAFSKLF